MKSIVLAVLMMPGICFLAESQEQMKKLEPMVGNWKGGGWYMDQAGKRYEFTQQEEISKELSNTALLIKGKGFSDGEVIHDAMAVVSYDSTSGDYNFHSFLSDGRKTDAKLKVIGDGEFEWGFKIPNGLIKYSIQIANDQWHEKGEFSPDGSNWYPFIDFNLSRK
ncbi:hypothetical protein [Ekhidna sp.]|uniref:hypothetical protein n=1 Tax=Ekhidna sp. TaxID=2608089 RepID=UPI003B5CD394